MKKLLFISLLIVGWGIFFLYVKSLELVIILGGSLIMLTTYFGKRIKSQREQEGQEKRRKTLISQYGEEDGMLIFNGEITEDSYVKDYFICPECGKGTREHINFHYLRQHYLYETKDGDKDYRYKYNPLYSTKSYTVSCKHCGHNFSKIIETH